MSLPASPLKQGFGSVILADEEYVGKMLAVSYCECDNVPWGLIAYKKCLHPAAKELTSEAQLSGSGSQLIELKALKSKN